MHKMIFINLRLLKIDYKIQHTIAFWGFWFKKKIGHAKKNGSRKRRQSIWHFKSEFQRTFLECGIGQHGESHSCCCLTNVMFQCYYRYLFQNMNAIMDFINHNC